MSNIDTQPFPRLALVAAAVLMVGAIVAAAVGRSANLNAAADATEAVQPLAARNVTFFDMENGSVEVRDEFGKNVLFVAAPGTNGFIRGVMRGLARNRRAYGFGQEEPFRLAEWPDGRLSLEDLATGKRIELGAFGAQNRVAFAQLLRAAGGSAT